MNVKNCSGLVVAGLGISLLSAIPAMGAPSAQAVAPGASEAFVRGLAGDDLAALAGDALKDSHALLHELKGLNIQQVGAREAVLCDKDRLLVPLDVREEFSGLAL